MVPDEAGHRAVQPASIGVIDRIAARIENLCGYLAAIAIFLMMLIGLAQVAMRVLWDTPFPGYIDIVEQMTAVAAFLAVAYAERLDAHIRMEFLPMVLRGRAQVALEILLVIIAVLTIAFLVYATWFSFLRSFELGDSSMDIRLPIWPTKLMLFVALCILLIRLLLKAIGFIRILGDGKSP